MIRAFLGYALAYLGLGLLALGSVLAEPDPGDRP